MSSVPIEGFTRLLEVLDKLEIQYAVGGSTASSVHGVIRFTRDVDLAIRIAKEQVHELAKGDRGEKG